jgi:hypothetical protein
MRDCSLVQYMSVRELETLDAARYTTCLLEFRELELQLIRSFLSILQRLLQTFGSVIALDMLFKISYFPFLVVNILAQAGNGGIGKLELSFLKPVHFRLADQRNTSCT